MAASSPSSTPKPPPTPLPTTAVDDLDDDIDVRALVDAESGPSNLADLVARNAVERPEEPALIQPGEDRRVLTWSELDGQVSALAAGLVRHGVRAGHRLAFRGPTSIPYVVGYLSALRAGVVVVPLAVRAGTELSARWLAESGARLLLGVADMPTGSEIETLPLTAAGIAELADPGAAPVVSPPDRESLAVLLYTAGTAEEPRPVMLSHRALLAGIDETGPGRPDADSVIGLALPLSGAYGLAAILGSWIGAGCRLVVSDERADLARLAADESITHLPLTPPLIFRLLQRATHAGTDLRAMLASVVAVVSAGARLPWPLTREFSEQTGLRLEQAYGLTETARGVSSTLGAELLGPGHVGRALPGVEIRIGDGTDDEPGEIAVRGEMLFSGYWPDGAGGPDPDGWWRTGDLGYLRGEDLFVLDRARDLISISGFTIYPAEVEQVIGELEGVTAVAVIGAPAGRAGQRMVAFVSGTASPDEVLDYCRGRLAAFKRPSEVRSVDQLPRTVTGLIRRGALRRLLAAERADG
ncbi:class I adenylate-forming enzyme family protein [Microlunatus ginsengisoli]|uniref:class I adenylate-forming enzyme family protein n=1 Tax=Microlunatus ginsengisoli TaxID=363863 RepID=UPI0031E47D4F